MRRLPCRPYKGMERKDAPKTYRKSKRNMSPIPKGTLVMGPYGDWFGMPMRRRRPGVRAQEDDYEYDGAEDGEVQQVFHGLVVRPSVLAVKRLGYLLELLAFLLFEVEANLLYHYDQEYDGCCKYHRATVGLDE